MFNRLYCDKSFPFELSVVEGEERRLLARKGKVEDDKVRIEMRRHMLLEV